MASGSRGRELPRVEQPQHEDVLRVFNDMRSQGRSIPDVHKILANAPNVLQAFTALAWPLRYELELDAATRQLIIMYVSRLLGGQYEWAHHFPEAIESGVAEEGLNEISVGSDLLHLDLRQREVLALVERMVTDATAAPEQVPRLLALMPANEVVEVIVLAGFYIFVTKMTQTFDVQVEEEFRKFRPPKWAPEGRTQIQQAKG